MPVYNGERFLKEALDSLCAQTYSDWNIYISDDGSTDSTEAICRLYAEKDTRINYYRQPKNIGMFENFKYISVGLNMIIVIIFCYFFNFNFRFR